MKRGITELITPGLTMGDNVLNARENNFLAALTFGVGEQNNKISKQHGNQVGIALLDISTGEFLCTEGTYDYVDKLINNYAPKEMLQIHLQVMPDARDHLLILHLYLTVHIDQNLIRWQIQLMKAHIQ